MKKLLFVFVLAAFAACGNGGSDATTTESTTTDSTTMSSGSAMSADTSANTMNADTSSKVGADTGTMNTAH